MKLITKLINYIANFIIIIYNTSKTVYRKYKILHIIILISILY